MLVNIFNLRYIETESICSKFITRLGLEIVQCAPKTKEIIKTIRIGLTRIFGDLC